MNTVVFENALGGIFGANEQGCFCGQKFKGSVRDIREGSSVTKASLGSESVLIDYDRISYVSISDTTNHPVFVGAKGLADDIGAHALSVEDQNEFMEHMKASLPDFKLEEKRSTIMETAGKTLIFSIVSAVLTATSVWVAIGSRLGAEIQSTRGGRRGNQQRIFIELTEILGPFGSLLVGGTITAFLVWVTIRKLKNRFPIHHLSR